MTTDSLNRVRAFLIGSRYRAYKNLTHNAWMPRLFEQRLRRKVKWWQYLENRKKLNARG